MWKLLVAAAVIINIGEAQRSSYAPRPGSNSKLLPRFRKNETDSGLGTRGGQEEAEDDSSMTPSPEVALEDQRFIHRVSQWPEHRQPFWYKNRYAISSMRDRDIDGGNVDPPIFQNQRPRPQFQSPFQGSSRVATRAGQLNNGPFYYEDFMRDFLPPRPQLIGARRNLPPPQHRHF